MRFVIVPGIGGSDSFHWQSIWQAEWGPIASRIEPASWTAPDAADWIAAVDRAITEAGTSDVVLVAHSLGCWAAAGWLAEAQRSVRGAFLVAPPDPDGPEFPAAAASFADLTPAPVGVPGLVVASLDDPYCRPGAAAALARGWGLPVSRVGAYRHLNSASGIGGWQQGRVLLAKLLGSTATAVA
ncbi:RBBP9/YdeN family alpha/beta hydrolase [Microlunatus ginsengisoli]|uniref:Alpha/beta hydrolase n=1 Tax=Microlunatus ginsengisoli TaxID=363863 RepID=A0ABP7ACD3_9ACTN